MKETAQPTSTVRMYPVRVLRESECVCGTVKHGKAYDRPDIGTQVSQGCLTVLFLTINIAVHVIHELYALTLTSKYSS